MTEKFKREVLTRLSTILASEELKKVDEVLTVVLTGYELTERNTELTVYQEDIPEEIKSFLASKSLKGLARSSLAQYKRTLVHYANNITKDIKYVGPNDIRLYLLTYQHVRNISKSALDDKRRILNSFYTWLVRENMINRSPMLQIDPIKSDKKVRQPLTAMEMKLMRNTCKTPREKALLEVLYSTGCRVSELIRLNRNDIDYYTGIVKVLGKGSKERFCFLSANALTALKEYLATRSDNNNALFVAGKFPHNRLGKGSIEKEISNIGIRAGIKRRVFPHLIRHTMATHMLNNGASLTEVQMILGHENPATTQIYAKLDLRKLQAVHKKCIA